MRRRKKSKDVAKSVPHRHRMVRTIERSWLTVPEQDRERVIAMLARQAGQWQQDAVAGHAGYPEMSPAEFRGFTVAIQAAEHHLVSAGAPPSRTCHDCFVGEGELHARGCDMERCPFCGGQEISCGCHLKHFYPTFDRGDFPGQIKFSGLPESVYRNGLPPKQRAEWERVLARKGRIPYIVWPNLCGRCGMLWPEMFMVPDREWDRYVEPAMRERMLCRGCYDQIRKLIDTQSKRPGKVVAPCSTGSVALSADVINRAIRKHHRSSSTRSSADSGSTRSRARSARKGSTTAT